MTTATTTAAPTITVITKDIQQRVSQIITEMETVIKSRSDVIHGYWVARVANLHLLMLGPGGTGKSFLVRDAVSHIEGAKLFEVALDETTDPGQVFGPPDIPAMVKQGKQRRVVDSMLPEATDAFVDEIFNGNSPVLHSLMPIMNERIFHNNGMPSKVPLRMLCAGTNKINADADLAAFFDRLHIRYVVDYLDSRTDQADMVSAAIARMSVLGRGVGTSLATTKTMVTLDELDIAHKEALSLSVPDAIMDLFLDLRAELRNEQIIVSDRRMVEGMAAVLANAWIRGHEEVRAADLDILANMWWVVQDQIPKVRQIVLNVANPGEKAALDLLKQFREVEATVTQAQANRIDDARLRRVGIEAIRNTDALIKEASEELRKAKGAGANTARLDDLIDRVRRLKVQIGKDIFNIDAEEGTSLTTAQG